MLGQSTESIVPGYNLARRLHAYRFRFHWHSQVMKDRVYLESFVHILTQVHLLYLLDPAVPVVNFTADSEQTNRQK